MEDSESSKQLEEEEDMRKHMDGPYSDKHYEHQRKVCYFAKLEVKERMEYESWREWAIDYDQRQMTLEGHRNNKKYKTTKPLEAGTEEQRRESTKLQKSRGKITRRRVPSTATGGLRPQARQRHRTERI